MSDKAYYAYKRQERHKALGLCRYCSEPVFANTLLCKKHLFSERKKARQRTKWKGLNTGRKPAEAKYEQPT